MSILKVAGITVVACFTAMLLRKERPEQAMAVGLMGGVAVLGIAFTVLTPVLRELQLLFNEAAGTHTYTAVIFRALGVCLLTQMAADTCRDAGETALAAKAELAGKVLLLCLALPLFRQVLSLATGWLQTR